MKRVSIYGLNKNRKSILETIHKSEVIEVVEKDYGDKEVYRKDVSKAVSQFENYMKSAKTSISILDKYTPRKTGFISSRRILPLDYYSMKTSKSNEVLRKIYQIIKLSDAVRENMENIRKIDSKQLALKAFTNLDIPMNIRETDNTFITSGIINGFWDENKINSKLLELKIDNIYFEVIKASKEYTTIWLMYNKKNKKQAELFLQNIGFVEPNFSLSHHTPEKKILVLENARKELQKEIDNTIDEIKKFSKYRDEIELFYDHLKLRKDKYSVLSKMGITEHAFILEGYIPEKYSEDLKNKLERDYNVYIELFTPEDASDVPVQFENNSVVSPVETVTETYSMPSVTDIDPNPIMAFFYYLFFGMMFSDAGYGLLVMLVCGYLGFSKKLEKPKRKSYKMFFYCGVSTTFWGLMYGSFFGNVINTVSVTFFNSDISLKPIWIDPVSEPLTLLIFSIVLGLIQILVGLGIKFYMLWRQNKHLDAIFDVGFWMLILVSVAVFALGSTMGMQILSNIGIALMIAGALGLIFTQGRHNKNFIGKLFGGVISLYGITSYVSDALSYSRLMALGLATGVIANVVSILGSIAGPGVVGAISFIVISILGHAMNFGINMLGAYVHTNRLQYVEFFSKFYEGGGHKFKPFNMDTEYYLING